MLAIITLNTCSFVLSTKNDNVTLIISTRVELEPNVANYTLIYLEIDPTNLLGLSYRSDGSWNRLLAEHVAKLDTSVKIFQVKILVDNLPKHVSLESNPTNLKSLKNTLSWYINLSVEMYSYATLFADS